MTISTPHTNLARRRSAHRAGFTLAEVIIAGSLSTAVLAGILSSFLLIGRTAYSSSNYSEMEMQVRRALETFGNDVRKSADIHWNHSQSVTLYVASTGSATQPVTYAYEPAAGGIGPGSFYRVEGDATSTEPRRVLVQGVANDFTFERFKLEQPGVPDNSAVNDLETKQLQVSLRAERTGATTVTQSQRIVSGRYILRNKKVTN